MTQSTIQNTSDLLDFLVKQSEARKDWFGFSQQRLTGVALAHEIAKRHANTMTPLQVVEYAAEVNQLIYEIIIRKS